MVISLQSVIKKVNKEIDKLGNTVLFIKESKTACPGAFNITGAYDKLQDVKYHKEHPDAPVCNMGYIVVHDTLQEKALIERVKVVSDEILRRFGNVEAGDLFASIKAHVNVEDYDFLEFNGKRYKIESKQDDIYGDVRIKWYVHLKRGDAYGS